MIRRFKIHNYYMVYCDDIDLITHHYFKYSPDIRKSAEYIMGYQFENKIIFSNVDNAIHELTHILDNKITKLINNDKYIKVLYIKTFNKVKRDLKSAGYSKSYLKYRLIPRELLAFYTTKLLCELTYSFIESIDLGSKEYYLKYYRKHFIKILRKLKNSYNISDFRYYYLRILAKLKFFKILDKIYQLITNNRIYD